jgi:hypothetical protein
MCPSTAEAGLPVEAHGKTERIPQASIKTLPGVSHVPMIDDPGLVVWHGISVTYSGQGQAASVRSA